MRSLTFILALIPALAFSADDSAGYSQCLKAGGTVDNCRAQYRPEAHKRLQDQKDSLAKSKEANDRMNTRLDQQYKNPPKQVIR